MAKNNNHKNEEPVGWVTVKGKHFPKWKDGTIGWQEGREELAPTEAMYKAEREYKRVLSNHVKNGTHVKSASEIAKDTTKTEKQSKKYSKMTMQELKNLDISKMNQQERKALMYDLRGRVFMSERGARTLYNKVQNFSIEFEEKQRKKK